MYDEMLENYAQENTKMKKILKSYRALASYTVGAMKAQINDLELQKDNDPHWLDVMDDRLNELKKHLEAIENDDWEA